MIETEARNWGGARAGAGRKKGARSKSESERRTRRIVVLATEEQEARLKEMAARAEMSVSSYLLSVALQNN